MSAPVSPVVSVVVPTHDRAELLPIVLGALAGQRDAGAFEIVVVDDGSRDGTADALARLAAELPAPLHVISVERPGGPARARNLGWRAARGRVIAFLDDDCRPDAGWLAALLRASAGAEVVQGLTEAEPDQAPGSGPFARMLVIATPSGKFETCNIAYARETLARLGGFDETFPAPFGEDINLGLRALAAGASVSWCPEAIVYHRVERSGSRLADWRNALRHARRCELVALTLRMTPAFRRQLGARCFYKPYHAHTLLLLAALPLVRRAPGRGLALAAPWLWYRTVSAPRPAPRKWLWAVLPLGAAVDLTELLATMRGALRYRTFVL